MARTVNPVLISNTSETFATWVAKTNTIIDHLSTVVVTTAATANGDATSGNAFVVGILGANTIACDSLRAGNVQTNGATITVYSNLQMDSTQAIVAANVYIGNSMSFSTSTNTSTTTADQIMVALPTATWRGGKFVVTVKNNNANGYHMTEFLILNDGTNALYTEYAALISNSSLGTFAANVSGGNLNVLYSPTSTNTQVTVTGTLIKV